MELCKSYDGPLLLNLRFLRHRNLSTNHNEIRRCIVEGQDLSTIGFDGLITVDDGIAPFCQEQFG